jgi:hypothetical protein
MPAEHHVDQRARAIDGTIQITPVPVDLDVGLIDIPALTRLAASASPQIFCQCRCELGFPVANRLVAEHDAADQEHLRQITQGKLITQAPEHHEGDNVAGVLTSGSESQHSARCTVCRRRGSGIGDSPGPCARSVPKRLPSRTLCIPSIQSPSPRPYTQHRAEPNRAKWRER